jgi:hypothetical protein
MFEGTAQLETRSGSFTLVVKDPAADAMDAPQPWGLLFSPVMKTISFFRFSV